MPRTRRSSAPENPPGPAGPPDLASHLRRETAAAHSRLEQSLSLLSQPLDRQRFVRVLERFHGFHAVWECAIRQRSKFAAFHAPRARLPHLRRDLAALGRTTAEIRALPVCGAAETLAGDEAATLGSLYVMEGSTLGGQLIARALADAGWAPSGGITYFDPYGRRTGEMWRGFQGFLAAQDPDRDRAAAGACATFALLEEWLAA